MNLPSFRQISTTLALGGVALVLVQCSSSSGSTGPGDGGVHLTTSTSATTGAGGGSTTGSTSATTSTTSTTSTTVGTGGAGTGGSGSGGGPPGGNCAPAADDDACTMCLKGKCCDDLNACAADPDCLALLDCVGQCADQACINMCAAQHPNGLNTITPLLQCTQTTCGTECMMKLMPVPNH
jgi:hypothetical protein